MTATRHTGMTGTLSLLAEAGHSRFQLGRAGLSLSQRHLRAGLGLTAAHSATRRSHLGVVRLTARSYAMELVQDRLTYRHEIRVGSAVTPWFGAAIERTDRQGSVMLAGSRAREGSFGLRWRGGAQRCIRQSHHSERFRHPLPFLAGPHRAVTRLTSFDLTPETGRLVSNLKVVLSFEYRKISSQDPTCHDPAEALFCAFIRRFKD